MDSAFNMLLTNDSIVGHIQLFNNFNKAPRYHAIVKHVAFQCSEGSLRTWTTQQIPAAASNWVWMLHPMGDIKSPVILSHRLDFPMSCEFSGVINTVR